MVKDLSTDWVRKECVFQFALGENWMIAQKVPDAGLQEDETTWRFRQEVLQPLDNLLIEYFRGGLINVSCSY